MKRTNSDEIHPSEFSDEKNQSLKSSAPIKQLISECGFSYSQALNFQHKCTGESIELERLLFFIVTNWVAIKRYQGSDVYSYFADQDYASSYLITHEQALEELTKSIFELRMITIRYLKYYYHIGSNKILTETIGTGLTSSIDTVGLFQQVSIFWTPEAYAYFECLYRLNRDGTLPLSLSTAEPSV